MSLCFIDTETSNLPDNEGRIIEIAWKIYNERSNPLVEAAFIISPSGEWEMGKKAQAVHGISKADVLKYGHNFEKVYQTFCEDLKEQKVKYIIGHNVSFDLEMLRVEGKELDCKILCTQKIGQKYLGLKPKDKLSLEYLHRKLFSEPVEGAHGALDDVNATARCFFEMKRRCK